MGEKGYWQTLWKGYNQINFIIFEWYRGVKMNLANGNGTRENPWQLKTPSGTSDYIMYKDEAANPPALVCVVGKTELRYQLRCLEDLHAMLKNHGDWMLLGSADEQKPAADGTVEAWGRSPKNPVGGWYGLKRDYAAVLACTCRR